MNKTANEIPTQTKPPINPRDFVDDLRAKIDDINESLMVASQLGLTVKLDVIDVTDFGSLARSNRIYAEFLLKL